MPTEYFVVANSFAAPFCSDQSTGFVEGVSPRSALESFAADYGHPAGLYSASIYESADAYHKGEKHLARWLSNRLQAEEVAKAGKSAYSFMGHGPNEFEIDGKRFTVDFPTGGCVVPA